MIIGYYNIFNTIIKILERKDDSNYRVDFLG